MGEEIISEVVAEGKVKELAMKRLKEEGIKGKKAIIESHKLIEVAGMPLYEFRGYVLYAIKPEGLAGYLGGKSEDGKRYFTAQVHAITGQMITLSWR